MQSDHAVKQEVFLSGLHQCVLSSSGKNRDGATEDINLLIWPWWHASSTPSPPWSSLTHPFPLPTSPWPLSMSHTLYSGFCMQAVFFLNTALVWSSSRVVVVSYILEATALSISTETLKVLEEVNGKLINFLSIYLSSMLGQRHTCR